MLENGKYSAWFRTSLGEGTGIVMLQDGKLTGGDTVIACRGLYSQTGDEFTADIAIHRHTAGQLSVFGIDNVDLFPDNYLRGLLGDGGRFASPTSVK